MATVKVEVELGQCTCEETQQCGLCQLKQLFEDKIIERMYEGKYWEVTN